MVEALSISSGVAEALKRYEGARRAHMAPLICVCGSLYLLGSVIPEVLRQDGVVIARWWVSIFQPLDFAAERWRGIDVA